MVAALAPELKRFGTNGSGQELEMTMKKMLLSLVGLIALAAPASAADLAARPYKAAPPMIAAIYDWSGFYIGANGGWGTSRKCWDQNTGLGGAFLANEGCHDATGGLFVAPFFAGTPFANRSKIDAFGLFTGQVGYAINNVLLYVKGGAAVVDDRYRGYNTVTGVTLDSNDDTRWGGVVGVGVEYGFSPNWSAAVAYDHLFMGNRTRDFTSTIAPLGFTREDRIRQDVDLVTVRVNYRWGGPVVAKY
jgi:outer membrane immunogenic protein